MFVPFSYSSFHPITYRLDIARFSDLLASYSIFVLPKVVHKLLTTLIPRDIGLALILLPEIEPGTAAYEAVILPLLQSGTEQNFYK
jgi:hypothetical protein